MPLPPPTHSLDREGIKAAIRRSGTTCQALGLEHGFSRSAVSKALVVPFPGVEAVIARHLGVPPGELWPDRYDAAGSPLRDRHGRKSKSIHSGRLDQRQKGRAA